MTDAEKITAARLHFCSRYSFAVLTAIHRFNFDVPRPLQCGLVEVLSIVVWMATDEDIPNPPLQSDHGQALFTLARQLRETGDIDAFNAAELALADTPPFAERH